MFLIYREEVFIAGVRNFLKLNYDKISSNTHLISSSVRVLHNLKQHILSVRGRAVTNVVRTYGLTPLHICIVAIE